MTKLTASLKRIFKRQPRLTPTQQVDIEREQRVAARDRIDYSYTVFWTKTARQWDAPRRSAVEKHLAVLIQTANFEANLLDRKYTLDELEGAHSGASLIALKKVLEALRDE